MLILYIHAIDAYNLMDSSPKNVISVMGVWHGNGYDNVDVFGLGEIDTMLQIKDRTCY